MPITSLSFTNVGPFDDIAFEFDKQVNVFTGPNNSGKSTTLMVLAKILVFPFLIPERLLKAEGSTWEGHFLIGHQAETRSGTLPTEIDRLLGLFENIGYTAFVPALRHSTGFSSTGPSTRRNDDSAIEEQLQGFARHSPSMFRERTREGVRQLLQTSRAEGNLEIKKRLALFETDAYLVSDEVVIQKIVDLDYRSYLRNEPSIRELLTQISTMASEITGGFLIGFGGVVEDDNGFRPQFQTLAGDVHLNTLSQGTQSIIQWLARTIIGYAEYYDYPPDLEDKPGILIIDEIDAHLHPSWQRRIIPTLTKHFPNLQIFCSTHSPLMLAGLKSGQVQLLRRDENGKVTVSRNESDIIGWTADEILRNFLDVPSPTDLTTADHLNRLQQLRHKERLSNEETEELEQLRHTVNEDLLAGPMASQVAQLAEVLRQARTESSASSDPPPSPTRATRRRRKPPE